MDFTIELTEFPSAMHSVIYSKGRGIMPLSRTLDAVSDSALRDSCVALHGFMTDMLSDMYDSPEAYHLPVMKFEEFLGGRDIHEVKRESTAKLKKLLSQTGFAVNAYLDFLCRVGKEGRLESNTFVVPAERSHEIIKRANKGSIPLNKVLEGFSRVGFKMETMPTGECWFTSKNYPDMFLALHALPWDNFGMLDFRNINGIYKPTYDDYFEPLVTEQRELAFELHNFAAERKMRASLNANWGVIYHYKGKYAIKIGTGDDIGRFLSVSVVAKDRTEDSAVIDRYLGKEPQDFQEQALRCMSGCDANKCLGCSTYSSGNYVKILGKHHQMCGAGVISFDWREPIPADIAVIKRLIEIRCDMIDETQAAKKSK